MEDDYEIPALDAELWDAPERLSSEDCWFATGWIGAARDEEVVQ